MVALRNELKAFIIQWLALLFTPSKESGLSKKFRDHITRQQGEGVALRWRYGCYSGCLEWRAATVVISP